MNQILEIYRRWLDGSLAQEDALFAIGDVFNQSESTLGCTDWSPTTPELDSADVPRSSR
jgi:hypothetical protein